MDVYNCAKGHQRASPTFLTGPWDKKKYHKYEKIKIENHAYFSISIEWSTYLWFMNGSSYIVEGNFENSVHLSWCEKS